MQEEKKTEDGLPEDSAPAQKTPAAGALWIMALDWLQALVWSVVIVALSFTFGLRLIGVEGNSMEPTLYGGDMLLVLSSLWGEPHCGDIVVLRKDAFVEMPIVKRVIATEGQTIDIDFSTGTVTLDGEVLEEPYLKEPTLTAGDMTFPFTVSPGCIFVMGDHRSESTDSRWTWLGEVDCRYVLGKAVWLIFPGPDESGRAAFGRIGGLN